MFECADRAYCLVRVDMVFVTPSYTYARWIVGDKKIPQRK
jgi:hypothetical protein